MRSDGRTCINETERVSARRRDRSSLSFLACSSKDARSTLSLDAPPRATRFAVLNDPSNIFPESQKDGSRAKSDGAPRRRTLVARVPGDARPRSRGAAAARASRSSRSSETGTRAPPRLMTPRAARSGSQTDSSFLCVPRAEDARCGARHIDETNTLSFFRRASAHRLAPVVARCELGRARFRRIRRSRHAMATAGMRGLNIFIQDVRNAANKEVEQERVDKELANIRKKFKKVKDMTPYDRKKCVMRRAERFGRLRGCRCNLGSHSDSSMDQYSPRAIPRAQIRGDQESATSTHSNVSPRSSRRRGGGQSLSQTDAARSRRFARRASDHHHHRPPTHPPSAGTCGSFCTSTCSGTRWSSGTCTWWA